MRTGTKGDRAWTWDCRGESLSSREAGDWAGLSPGAGAGGGGYRHLRPRPGAAGACRRRDGATDGQTGAPRRGGYASGRGCTTVYPDGGAALRTTRYSGELRWEFPRRHPQNLTEQDWMLSLNLKFMGYVRTAKAAIPYMQERRWGVSSMSLATMASNRFTSSSHQGLRTLPGSILPWPLPRNWRRTASR